MADDRRVQQLLDQLLNSQSTPEEVCSSCPELLPIVRERWRQMCRVRDDLDELFPPSNEPIVARPVGWLDRLWRRFRRNRRRAD
jgi:serine/threonine-protein kinase